MTYDAAKRVAPMGTAHAAAHRFIAWISQISVTAAPTMGGGCSTDFFRDLLLIR
jgi:hypothetical protein